MAEQSPLGWLNGEAPVNPGVVDTNNLDAEMRVREQDREKADALKWLHDGDADAAAPQLPQTIVPPREDGWLDIAGRVGKDMATGLAESPKQILLGGPRDAAQSVIDLAGDLGEWMHSIFNPDLQHVDNPQLPQVAEPKSVTGAGLRSISQFATGFLAGGLALKSLKTAGMVAKAIKTGAQGAISDFAAFDGHQQRLSDVVQSFPTLQNPVTEFLASSPNDSETEGRLKNAIEGVGLGAVAGGLIKGIKLFRAVQQARQAATPTAGANKVLGTIATDSKSTLREAQSMNLLGDESAPLVQTSARKLKQAAKETELPVPEDVAAKGMANAAKVDAGGKEVYINFARIQAPEDIQAVMGQMADAFSGGVDAARRGIRTNVQTAASADQENAWQILIERRKGQPLNAEQSYAARQLWTTAADKLSQVASVAATSPTTENLFQFRRMLAVTHAIQKEVIGARTETARALQQWAMPAGGNMQKFQGIMNALDREGGETVSAELAKRILAASQSDAPYATIAKMTERGAFAKTIDAVHEYWVNALLSGPKTHIVNALSNTSVTALGVVERAIAAHVFSGEDGVQAGEAMAQLYGIKSALGDAFVNAGKAFRSGQTGYGVNYIEAPRTKAISSTAFDLNSDSGLGRVVDMLGAAVNVPGRSLQASDEFFKTVNYRMALNALAHRTAQQDIRAGRIPNTPDAIKGRIADILADPPEGLAIDAAKEAAYRTFTDDPGPITRVLMNARNKIPLGRWILPFLNTPVNIFKFAFERTPLAPISASYRAAIARGGPDAAMARAKVTLGTSMMALAADWAADGKITGSGPPPGPERDNWLRQGNRPYSVRLDDTWVAYNRLDPTGFLVGMAADISEFGRNVDLSDDTEAALEEIGAGTAFSAADNLNSKSYLQGFANLSQAINDPKQYARSYLTRFAGSFIPAGVAEAARALDPVQRVPVTMLDNLKARTPGWSSTLPPRRDLYGRARTYESGLGTAYDVLSPLYGSTIKPEPIDQEMQKSNYFIGMPQKGITVDKQFVSFRNRPDAYSRYLELQGATKPSQMKSDAGAVLQDRYGDHTLLETLNGIVTGKVSDLSEYHDGYAALTDSDDKRDYVMRVVTEYRRAARDELRIENPWIDDKAAVLNEKAQGQSGPLDIGQ